MSGVIANIPKFQFFDSSGAEAVNYKLYTYLAGTLTPATTYQDQALGSANTNPIILDARGECAIWLDSTKSYKFILQTPSGSTIWTTDNISGGYASIDAVSKTGTETLTNKTLISPVISGGTIEATSGPGATQLSSRNKIINGDFRVNQRAYVSAAAVGAGLYGHDRWKMAGSADTYTFATVNNKTTVTIPASKVLQQVVEGTNLQTGTYVLSWEGTAQGRIGAGALAASGVTGAITGGTNTTIEFGPGTVANIQLEQGNLPTPFESLPLGLSKKLCEDYYREIFVTVAGYSSAPGQFLASAFIFPAMRASPSFALSGGTPVSVTSETSVVVSANTFKYGITASALGQCSYVDRKVALSAEL